MSDKPLTKEEEENAFIAAEANKKLGWYRDHEKHLRTKKQKAEAARLKRVQTSRDWRKKKAKERALRKKNRRRPPKNSETLNAARAEFEKLLTPEEREQKTRQGADTERRAKYRRDHPLTREQKDERNRKDRDAYKKRQERMSWSEKLNKKRNRQTNELNYLRREIAKRTDSSP